MPPLAIWSICACTIHLTAKFDSYAYGSGFRSEVA